MSGRNWSDQPVELEGAEVVLSTYMDFPAVGGHGVEILHRDGAWYLTTGNLFGSQTVKCTSAENLLRCLNLALHAKKDAPVSVAPFGELMPAPI